MDKLNLETIGSQLAENASHFPTQDALIFPGNCRFTWKELDREVDRVAAGMIASGVSTGTHLALWATNRSEWVLIFLAAARIGAVVISVDPALPAPELRQQLLHSDSELLFMAAGVKQNEYVEIVNELIPLRDISSPGSVASPDFPKLRSVILFGAEQPGFTSFDHFVDQGSELEQEEISVLSACVTADTLVNIQYTSAAFGTPKGVMLSQYAILNNGFVAGQNLSFSHSDRLCLPLPFFHAFGCSLGLMLCLAHGSTLVALERFTPEDTLKAVSVERCTALHGVPTMFLAALETEQFAQYDLSSLRTGIMAGAPCPVDLMVDVIEKMNASDITIAYGQTEAGPLITQTSVDELPEQRVATVGRPLTGVAVKVINPSTGEEADVEAEGEICARSTMLMSGYYKMADETSQSLDQDGWLHTGDLAIKDASGRFRITGRLRNMIIRGGQNIYPAEVETCLRQHPAVHQVQVYGVPDRKLGEIVVAKIVLLAGQVVEGESLRSFCNGRIAHYKIPASIEFVANL